MVQVQSSWFPLYDRNRKRSCQAFSLPSQAITERRRSASITPPSMHRMWRCRWWRTEPRIGQAMKEWAEMLAKVPAK